MLAIDQRRPIGCSGSVIPVYGTVNLDKCHSRNSQKTENIHHGLGQISVSYLTNQYSSGGGSDLGERVRSRPRHSSSGGGVPLQHIQRQEALAKMGIDVRSCLQFLLDLYSGWMAPETETPLVLLTETALSVVQLSDVFIQESQFQWMFERFSDLLRCHPSEDELLTSLLKFGVCKAVAVLGPDLSGQGGPKYHINQTDSATDPDLVDRLKKFTEAGLRGSRLATQTLALHGVFYLLQTENPRVCFAKNTLIWPFSCTFVVQSPVSGVSIK